jgi:hypothetical protein
MHVDSYFNFVMQAAKKLRTALFIDCSGNDFPFPSNLISLLYAEKNGSFYFLVRKPFTDLEMYSEPFFAQLHFFNKRLPFYLTVEGVTNVVGRERAKFICALSYAYYNSDQEVLLHFKLRQAIYTVQQRKRKRPFLSLLRSLAHWMFFESIDPWQNLSIALKQ